MGKITDMSLKLQHVVASVFQTHHAGCLYSLRHVAGIWITPEYVTVETMSADIHDEGKGVHIPADTHKRQETDATLHQHLLFILVAHKCAWMRAPGV